MEEKSLGNIVTILSIVAAIVVCASTVFMVFRLSESDKVNYDLTLRNNYLERQLTAQREQTLVQLTKQRKKLLEQHLRLIEFDQEQLATDIVYLDAKLGTTNLYDLIEFNSTMPIKDQQ